jgi:hypothetical protein
VVVNHSEPVGSQAWQVNNTGMIPGGTANLGPAHGGLFAAYCNFESGTGTATLSDWLLTPQLASVANGDTLAFWTRTRNPAGFPDRLQVRLSAAGASTNVGVGSAGADVGDFTTLLLDINPTQVATGYPTAWTLETITVSGLAAPISGRFAFRYFVTNGGPGGANSEMIGVDDVAYTSGGGTGGGLCYGNCDHSTAVPFLNVLDFTCFVQKFAAADPYANCDSSTTAPTLNVLDFTCFVQKFAAGCSAP